MFEWTGNVGLVTVSDLLRASTNIACTSASDELYAVVGPTMKETCGSYLTEMSVGSEGIAYWTINAFSSENSDVQSAAWIVSFVKGYGGLFLYREAYYNNMIGFAL